MKTLLLLISISAVNLAWSQKVTVEVPLKPAGSFEAKASIQNPYYKKSKGKLIASKVFVKVKDLKTGIELRDDHLYERLKSKKFPKIKLLKAVGKSGKGKASIEIRGVKRELPFTYSEKSKKVSFEFEIPLKKFKFDKSKDKLSYMGVGVGDVLKVSGSLKKK